VRAASSLAGGEATDLLKAVAEQLKVPLTIIARQAELSQLVDNAHHGDWAAMHAQASTALTLVDSYLLGLELAREQAALELEPVSIPSVLTMVAHDLYHLARQNGVELEVQVEGKYGPVMAHKAGLRAALVSLGYGMIEANSERNVYRRLTLAAHRTPHGIVAGIYGPHAALETQEWRTALKLYGRVSQPLTSLSSGSGAGLFVADAILRSMSTQLRVGRHQKETGLATTLHPSQQMTFV